jgi:hypothetical protein
MLCAFENRRPIATYDIAGEAMFFERKSERSAYESSADNSDLAKGHGNFITETLRLGGKLLIES